MCGITGITSKIENKEEVIRRMTDIIAHRGPDDDGFHTDEYAALGMRRLAIIDLVHGDQPITTSDSRYKIFFNGEIYNYRELKSQIPNYEFQTESDTEVILAGYAKWGPEVLNRLRGMFAFCIYDTREKTVFLARDFFGIKPLYYLVSGESLIAFASEIKAFLELPNFEPEVNDAAAVNFLSYQYNPLEETFFKNIFKLPPAYYMTIDLKTGKWDKKRYWQFEFAQDGKLNEEETKEKILETMRDSVAHHMIADVPVGSFLSGGIDSSIIATLMGSKTKTFTVTFGSVSEGLEAKQTAEPLGTDHREISVGPEEFFGALEKAVWPFDEPVADPSAIGLYFLAREARKHVKVVLSGEGADELFGGYNIYLAPLAADKLRWLPKFILRFLSALPLRGSNYAKRALQKLEDWYIGNASVFQPAEIAKLWRGSPISRATLDILYWEAKGLSDSTKMQYIDINTWLVGDILAKADKMTMAHSLELRVPFLDSSVASLASKLSDKFKWRNGETKYLLREAFKSILPESTRKRKKLGFPTPVGSWLGQDQFDKISENEYIKSHFSIVEVKKLFKEPKVNARKIYLLLMLALWYNVFIENSKLKTEN